MQVAHNRANKLTSSQPLEKRELVLQNTQQIQTPSAKVKQGHPKPGERKPPNHNNSGYH